MKRLSLAALGCDEKNLNGELRSELDRMGYASIEFENLKDLVAALNEKGWRFDVVFYVFRQIDINRLLTLIGRVPIFLIIDETDWDSIPSVLSELFNSNQAVEVVRRTSLGFGQVKRHIQPLLALMSLKADSANLNPLGMDEGVAHATAYHFSSIGTVVHYGGKRVRLSRLQYELALLMFENHGRTLKRSMLKAKFWPGRPQSRSLDFCVSTIRKSLELDGSKGALLESIYGQGYRLSLGIPLGTKE